MKTYINPMMKVKYFSAEEIVTGSQSTPTNTGLAEWKTGNADGKIVTKNVSEMSDMLKFTF